MEVIYRGPGPHSYHSAPSTYNYIFFPGVAQKVKEEDEEFFRNMAKSPNSDWEIVGIVEQVENAAESAAKKLTETVKGKFKKGGKK